MYRGKLVSQSPDPDHESIIITQLHGSTLQLNLTHALPPTQQLHLGSLKSPSAEPTYTLIVRLFGFILSSHRLATLSLSALRHLTTAIIQTTPRWTAELTNPMIGL